MYLLCIVLFVLIVKINNTITILHRVFGFTLILKRKRDQLCNISCVNVFVNSRSKFIYIFNVLNFTNLFKVSHLKIFCLFDVLYYIELL